MPRCFLHDNKCAYDLTQNPATARNLPRQKHELCRVYDALAAQKGTSMKLRAAAKGRAGRVCHVCESAGVTGRALRAAALGHLPAKRGAGREAGLRALARSRRPNPSPTKPPTKESPHAHRHRYYPRSIRSSAISTPVWRALCGRAMRTWRYSSSTTAARTAARRSAMPWAEKDPRIKVIHRENGGLSAARNSGIDAAMGEFVLFVDR